MISIYTPQATPRLQYVFRVVFTEVLGIEFNVISSEKEFEKASGVRINYSDNDFRGSMQIIPSGLLSETGIQSAVPATGKWDDLPVLFPNGNRSVPFDLFSAVFYLVTRYEEYSSYEPDTYGRYKAENSIAFKTGFLNLPVVDLWCKRLAELLQIERGCPAVLPVNYRFRLTVDIDMPWTYKHRTLFRTAGMLGKQLLKLNFQGFSERFDVIAGNKQDPADTYDLLREAGKKLKMPVHYFILCRNRGKEDVNFSVTRKEFRELVSVLKKSGTIGIHPSFHSSGKASLLRKEVSYLGDLADQEITCSRQHYLMLKFPDTYRLLEELDIREDFSMGFSSQTGFRAGIARSFNFYDLLKEEESNLRITPFQIMDRTLLSYLNLTPDEAMKEFQHYTEIIKNVGGEFVCLWHNDSLGDYGEWKGWREVFQKTIEMNLPR